MDIAREMSFTELKALVPLLLSEVKLMTEPPK